MFYCCFIFVAKERSPKILVETNPDSGLAKWGLEFLQNCFVGGIQQMELVVEIFKICNRGPLLVAKEDPVWA